MGRRSVTLRADHSYGMGVIHRQSGTVALRQTEQRREVGDVSFHGVHSVNHHHHATI